MMDSISKTHIGKYFAYICHSYSCFCIARMLLGFECLDLVSFENTLLSLTSEDKWLYYNI